MSFANVIFTGIFILSFFVSGCMNNPPGVKEKVVAKIDKFELTVDDFKEGVNPLLVKKYSVHSSKQQKDQILEELIAKEILLQEAQRLNLDKQRSFMKEIEGYWEQALMKSLINKKLKELSALVQVNSKDILEEYAHMKLRINAQMVLFNGKPDAEKLSKATANFDEIKQALKSKIAWEVPADWYIVNDLPQKLEDVIFSMKMGEVSAPVEYDGSWIVVRVLNEEPQQVGTLEELKPRITEDIVRKKKEALLNNWILELRSKANVKIYRETLSGVDLR